MVLLKTKQKDLNMISSLKQIDFKYFPTTLIIIYVPFHLFEEAINNFPLWMFDHYHLPKPLSYPHWLINNSIFLIVLLSGMIIYNTNRTKFMPFALAIVIWAFMNSLEHIVFSFYDLKVSPGLLTAILFFMISIFGVIKLRAEKILNPALIFKSILIAIGYWVVSFLIIIAIGYYFS